MDLYAENILDHYRHPRKGGALTSVTVSRREENVSCGDDVTIDLLIEENMIRDIAWHGKGCAISQAAMSLLAEALNGKSVDEISKMNTAHIRSLLGVPIGISREKCAFLCLHTLQNALHIWKGEKPQSWRTTIQIDK
jgi:nitrogen fixation protein NifU and related proteins